MKKLIVFAGFMGMLFIAGANAADRVATENHASSQATTAGGFVSTVETAATADATTNNTNAGTITAMQSGRQVTADNGPCGTYDTSKYSGCGYISADGASGEKQWIKIRKAI